MNKSKTFMTVSIAILIVTIIASSITYAWYTWSTSSEQETRIVTNLGAARVFYDAGANITNANLKPTATKEEGIVKRITVKTSKDTAYKISFNLYLDVISLDTGLKDASFKYALYKKGTDTAVAQGNFLNATLKTCETNNTSHIELVMDEVVTTTTSEYTLYIWIDGTMSNPNTMQSQNFNFKLHADGQNAVIGETLVEHINNLYNNAAKSPVENGDEGSKISYNYAASVSLMNDRLGTMSVGANNGNIRYYGASPNNYIDIGDVYVQDVNNWIEPMQAIGLPESQIPTTEEECKILLCGVEYDIDACSSEMSSTLEPAGYSSVDELCGITPAGTPKLYRIIGLFKDVELANGSKKDLIKVVRNKTIGNYSWDQSPEDGNPGDGINEWSQADLMKLLNPGLENEEVGGSLYWNSGSGSCYTMNYKNFQYGTYPCDFTNSGLNSAVHSKIEEVYWNLGGHDTNQVFSNQIYEYEREKNVFPEPEDGIKRTTVWPGRVALAYPSDYGYAVDLKSCDKKLSEYNDSTCTESNWIYNSLTGNVIIGGEVARIGWLLTPDSSDDITVYSLGAISSYGAFVSSMSQGVSPVFYLDSALGIVSGDGSEGNPYIVR